jgi:hypothetical protein
MKVKFLMAKNDEGIWAIAGHSKLLGDFSQLELVAASGMPGKIVMSIVEVDLDKMTVESIESYAGTK